MNPSRIKQITLMFFLLSILFACTSRIHLFVPNHKYVQTLEGYYIIDYGNDMYFFITEVDSNKDYFEDFLEKKPTNVIVHSAPETIFDSDAIIHLTMYAAKVELKPRNQDLHTHVLLVPARLEIVEDKYSKIYKKRESQKSYEETINLEGHKFTFNCKLMSFRELDAQVSPLLSDSVYTYYTNKFFNKK